MAKRSKEKENEMALLGLQVAIIVVLLSVYISVAAWKGVL